jgi:hypothetical protein
MINYEQLLVRGERTLRERIREILNNIPEESYEEEEMSRTIIDELNFALIAFGLDPELIDD